MATIFAKSFAEICGGRSRCDVEADNMLAAAAELQKHLEFMQIYLERMQKRGQMIQQATSRPKRACQSFGKRVRVQERIQTKHMISAVRARKLYVKVKDSINVKSVKFEPEVSSFKLPTATSKRQVKQRALIREVPNYDVRPLIKEPLRVPRQCRLGLLCEFLRRRTDKAAVLAEALVAGFARNLARNDPSFADKLRDVIPLLEKKDKVDGQMERESTDHGIDVAAKEEVAGSVVVEEKSVPSVNEPKIVRSVGLAPWSSAREQQTFNQLAQRWLRLKKTYVWEASMEVGNTLATIVLPRDAVFDNETSPNAMPFLNHRYARCDMCVKIMVNSNKFQVGQLQANWFYMASVTDHFKYYDNIYSASQRNHVLIDAGGNNDATIRIPYWHVRSLLSSMSTVEEKDNKVQPLDMGTLTIKVLNQLSTPDNVAKKAYLSILVSFENTIFDGVVERGIDKVDGQMDSLLNTAENVLHIINGPRDRDNPPAPDPARMFQPMAAHSLSVVNRQNEVIRPMRTDPTAQTSGVNASDGTESGINDLVRRWSLLKQVEWDVSKEAGNQLFSMPVAPVLNALSYASEEAGGIDYYRMPIISVVSSLFGYFRGGIEVRLDVVASQFHVGRLQLSVIPGYQKQTVDMDAAKNSLSKYMDISLDRRSEFVCEYFNSVPWARVNYGLDQPIRALAPSTFFLHVVNPLLPMDNVSSKIYINIYVRAATDFELSIPRTCPLTTPFSTLTLRKADIAKFMSGYVPCFTSGSRWLEKGADSYLSLFYDEITDHFTEFSDFKFGWIYKVPASIKVNDKDKKVQIPYVSGKDKKNVAWLCRAFEYPGYPVALCFESEAKAKAYCNTKDITQAIKYSGTQGDWLQISDNGSTFRTATSDECLLMEFVGTKVKEPSSEEWEFVEAQMESQTGSNTGVVRVVSPPKKTSFGVRTFGEQISDLRVLARRYQVLGCVSGTFHTKEGQCMANTGPVAAISLHPQKLMLQKPQGRDNMVREGVISLVQTGFAGYRGSLRIKIVYTGTSDLVNFCVVHRFDNPTMFGKQSVRPVAKTITRPGDYMDSGYATEMQSVVVNPVLEVEVPFYRQGEFNLGYQSVNRDIVNNFSGLGELEIYVTGASGRAKASDPVSYGFDVFYSVGDDFVFSNFQGFPPMLFLENKNFEPVQTIAKKTLEESISPEDMEMYRRMKALFEASNEVESVDGQMEYIKSFFTWPKSLGTLADTMSSCCASVSEKAGRALEAIGAAVTKVKDGSFIRSSYDALSGWASACGDFTVMVLTQILHIVSNPTRTTVGIAIAAILCYVFSDRLTNIFNKVCDAVKRVWAFATGSKNEQPQSDETTASGQEDTDSATFMSLLWSIAGTVVGFVIDMPKNAASFAKGLFKSSTDMFRSHMYGVKFFRDIFEFFQRIWRWINRKLGRTSEFYTLAQDDKALKAWFLTSELILQNKDEVKQNRDWALKAFECQVIGNLYKMAAINSKDNMHKSLFSLVLATQNKLTEFVDELVGQRECGNFRVAPFGVWISGPPGVGKSEFITQLSYTLSSKLGLNGKLYNHVFGQQYFDSLTNQDILVVDDFLCTSDSNTLPTLLAQVLQMMNDFQLNLPRSPVELKTKTDHFKVVVVSSNQHKVHQGVSTSIKEPDAYNRRFHFRIKMTFKDKPENNDEEQRKCYHDYVPRTDTKTAKKIRDKDFTYARFSYSTDAGESWVEASVSDLLEAAAVTARRVLAQNTKTFLEKVKAFQETANLAAEGSISFEEYFKKIASSYNLSTSSLDISAECKNISKSLLGKYIQPQLQAEEISKKVTAEGSKIVKKLEEVKTTGPPKVSGFTNAQVHSSPDPEQIEELEPEPAEANMGKRRQVTKEDVSAAIDSASTALDPFEVSLDRAWDLTDQPKDVLEVIPEVVEGQPELPQTLTVQKKGPEVPFKNDPFSESGTCPHEAIGIHGVVPIRLSSETTQELKAIANDLIEPKFLLVNMNKIYVERFGVACYDQPCVIWNEGTKQHTLNGSCYLTTGPEEEREARRLQLFKNVCEQMRHKGLDPLQVVRANKIGDYMPIAWFDESVKPLLPKEVKIKDIPKHIINRIISGITLGTRKELLSVDGVQHVVDTNMLHKVERSRTVKNGLFFNTAVRETRTAWGGVRRAEVYEPTNLTVILLLIGIALAFCSYLCIFLDIIIWFIQFYKCFSFKTDAQIGTSGDIKMTKTSGTVVKAIQMVQSDGQLEQDSLLTINENLSPTAHIAKRIENNVVFLVAVKNHQIVRKARCIGLYGHTVLGLVHYFDSFRIMKQKDPEIQIGFYARMSKCTLPLEWDKIHYNVFEEGNFCTFELPKSFSFMFRNIVKYMPREGKIQYSSKMRLLEVGFVDTVAHELENVKFFSADDRKVYAESTPEWEGWTIPQRLEYAYGGAGVCGSVLLDPSSATPLVGIHTAGKGVVRGFSEPVVREMFPQALDPKKPVIEMVTPWVEANVEVESMENVPDGPHISIGHVPKGEGVVQPTQTKIEPSALFGKWENKTEPAPLTPNDPRTDGFRPLMEGVEKRCDPMKSFPKNYVKEAVMDYQQKFLAAVKPTVAQVEPLSWNDVVCGQEGVDFIDPMEMHTSEGYPWVKKRPAGFSDKRWLFDINYSKNYPQLSAMSKDLFDVLTLHEDMRDRHIVPCSFYTACLKDARIKKEKINVPGKTRVFEMSPVELTMAQRKYFLPVYSAYQSARFDIEHTIGIRVNGPEWSDLANRLLTFSPHILAGDYSSYGPKADLNVLLAVVDVHIAWLRKNGYSEAALRQCELLKYQILYSPHIIGRYLCKFIAGMPSGNAATVILNSGVNSIYIRIAWMAIMRQHGLGSLDNFHKYVLLFSNGDDIIMAVKPAVIHLFNNKTLMEFFKQHNLSYTNSKKDKEIVPYERLSDVQYLKCAFRPHPQRRQWLAELDIETVFETPLWVWKSREDLKVRTAQNVDQALRLAYGHGPERFEAFKQFLIQHCDDLDLYVPLPTWVDLDIMIWDKGEDLLGWFWG